MANSCSSRTGAELLLTAEDEAGFLMQRCCIERDSDIARAIITAIGEVLEDVQQVSTLHQLSSATTQLAQRKESELKSEFPSSIDTIRSIKETICASLRFSLYQEAITKLTLDIVEQAKDEDPPAYFGIGSLRNFGGRGDSLYKILRRITDSEEVREDLFRRKILILFPANWIGKFRMKQFCEYDWEAMDNRNIAKVINGLQKPNMITGKKWGLGTMHEWTDSKGVNVGKSLVDYLRKRYPNREDRERFFREQICIYLEAEMSNSFKCRKGYEYCEHDWQAMDNQAIASVLSTLLNSTDIRFQTWGLGTIERINATGSSFYNYWLRKYPESATRIETFEREILPIMSISAEMREKFSPRNIE